MTLKDSPSKLRPYLFHGVLLDHKSSSEPVSDCPFCGKEKKFFVSSNTGMFQCKSCSLEGNSYTFLRQLHEYSLDETNSEWVRKLANERGVKPEFLHRWGVVQSYITGEVIVPGFNIKGSMTNLYQWLPGKSGKKILMSTPTLRHGLFGVNCWNTDAKFALIAEGPWTGSACCQILAGSRGKIIRKGEKTIDVKVIPTRSEENSLMNEWNVVGIPGCGSFRDVWSGMFGDMDVLIIFDNDYPSEKSRSTIGAGWSGTLRTARLLLESDNPPASITGVQWGPDGYDPKLPNRYDLRDALHTNNGNVRSSSIALKDLTTRMVPIKNMEKKGSNGAVSKKTSVAGYVPAPSYCESYKEVKNVWRKALKWTDNLDVTLITMLSTAGSTSLGGMCPLWLRVIGTPGTAKSTLCEALAVSRKYTYSVSTMTGIHSGARDSEGNPCSMVPDMNNKTTIIKDGDTLINASNRDQILSQMRDIYEGTSRARYRNTRESQEYTDLKITYILAGTKSLRKMNRSFLGDRFLDVVIYYKGDDPILEKEILNRSAHNSLRQLRSEQDSVDSAATSREIEAKEITSGYLHYIRENMEGLINEVGFSEKRMEQCVRLGEFVSFMRARPDKESDEDDDETELATRLTSQLVRLSACNAVVMNRQDVDDEVMRLVKKVALDTSSGISLGISGLLFKHRHGLEARSLGSYLSKTPQKINTTCRFLQDIGVVQRRKRERANLWILTRELRRLMKFIV